MLKCTWIKPHKLLASSRNQSKHYHQTPLAKCHLSQPLFQGDLWHYPPKECTSSAKIREILGMKELVKEPPRQLRWLGHVEDRRMPKQALFSHLSKASPFHWVKMRWKDRVRKDCHHYLYFVAGTSLRRRGRSGMISATRGWKGRYQVTYNRSRQSVRQQDKASHNLILLVSTFIVTLENLVTLRGTSGMKAFRGRSTTMTKTSFRRPVISRDTNVIAW